MRIISVTDHGEFHSFIVQEPAARMQYSVHLVGSRMPNALAPLCYAQSTDLDEICETIASLNMRPIERSFYEIGRQLLLAHFAEWNTVFLAASEAGMGYMRLPYNLITAQQVPSDATCSVWSDRLITFVREAKARDYRHECLMHGIPLLPFLATA